MCPSFIMKNTILLSLALICLSFSSGCDVTHKFGPYFSKVVDAETKELIEGAVFFMKCDTVTGTLAETTTHYADAREVLTDEKGEFAVELRENIEIFYNRQRIQKKMGYCSPDSFAKKYFTETKKADRFGIHY